MSTVSSMSGNLKPRQPPPPRMRPTPIRKCGSGTIASKGGVCIPATSAPRESKTLIPLKNYSEDLSLFATSTRMDDRRFHDGHHYHNDFLDVAGEVVGVRDIVRCAGGILLWARRSLT